MIGTRRGGGRATVRLVAILAAGVAPGLWAGKAEAQWGGGWGWGRGFYNPGNAIMLRGIEQRSLMQGQAAYAHRPQPLHEPKFQSRDDSFYQRYDLATREAMINRVARDPSAEIGTADPSGVLPNAPAAAPVRSTVRLSRFYDQNHRLVWPSVAPVSGDLGAAREASDKAILAVYNEYESKGIAQVATVTDARRKLLAYGRPALKDVRQRYTPAIGDSFDTFLTSLYNQVGLAATVQKQP